MANFNEDVLINGILNVGVDLSEHKQVVTIQGNNDTGTIGFIRQFGTGPSIRAENTAGLGVGQLGVNTTGVIGSGQSGVGVLGESQENNGVLGISHHPVNAAVSAVNVKGGLGLWAESKGGASAAHFEGGIGVKGGVEATGPITCSGTLVVADEVTCDRNLFVKGDINGGQKTRITCFDVVISNGDCAEEFDIGENCFAEPGTVMVLGDGGFLLPSLHPYDKRVAGVIAGAGSYRPGIVLDKRESGSSRQAIALLGKVFCKVDASYGSIGVGDLLTTSPTPGHAMKADDPMKAFGAVIGKALLPLDEGNGLIPILVTLQ